MRWMSLAACVALCPFMVGASALVRLPPSSKWVLDYANDSCRLIRQFGEGATITKLQFQGVAPDEMTMLVIGGSLRPSPSAGEVKAQLLPGAGDLFTGDAAEAKSDGKDGPKGAAYWTSNPLTPGWKADRTRSNSNTVHEHTVRKAIDLVEVEAARAKRAALAATTTEITIIPASGRTMVPETGSLGKPIAMFDECERDLLREWGVDPAIQDRIVKPVWTASALGWFSSSDYPASALVRREESTVNVRLAVDSSGKVTKCVSISAYAAPEFNKVVCDIYLTRARFAPAELADGTKVASYSSQNITFKMPRF